MIQELTFVVGPGYPKSELIRFLWGYRSKTLSLEDAIAIRDQLEAVIGKVDRGRDEAMLLDEKQGEEI